MNIYSIKNKGVAGNIWKYGLMSITNKRSYLTFFSIFLLTMPGATEKTIGLIGLSSELFGFLLEIPSGYISDKIGHRNALIVGKSAFLCSTFIMIFANHPVYFFASAIFMAIAAAMNSGTSSVFLQDTLNSLDMSHRYSDIAGKLRSLGFAIPIIFIIGMPILADNFGYQVAFIAVALIDAIGLVAAISMKKPVREKHGVEFDLEKSDGIFKTYFKIGWLPVALLSSTIVALSLAATSGFKNPFQESLGFSISMLGILWAGSRLGVSLILLASSWFKKKFTFGRILCMQGLALVLVYMGIFLSTNKWVIAFLFMSIPMIMWGLSSVKSHFFLEYVQNMKNKASYISINNFIQKIIQAPMALLMGYLVFNKGYHNSYFIFGCLILLAVIIFTSYRYIKKPNQ